MKTRVASIACALAIGGMGLSSSGAETPPPPHPVVQAVDAVVVRPISFASVVVGGALFTLSLPVTAITKKVKPTAKALILRPAKATFKRPLGDMDAMAD
ncbi:MAG TPA: hypothetical protein VJA21_31400 [Verrucomicrobiae bacterium]